MEEYYLVYGKKMTIEEYNNLPIEERNNIERKAAEYYYNKILANYKAQMIVHELFDKYGDMLYKNKQASKEVIKMMLKQAVGNFSKTYVIDF